MHAPRAVVTALSVAAALAVSGAVPASASSAVVDCTSAPTRNPIEVVVNGDRASFTLRGCDDFGVAVLDGSTGVRLNGLTLRGFEPRDVTGTIATLTVDGSAIIGFVDDSGSSIQRFLTVVVANVIPDPRGTLLDTRVVRIGRSPAEFSLGTPRQQATAADVPLGKPATCPLVAGPHVYATSTLTVTAAGRYAVRVVGTSPSDWDLALGREFHPLEDPFLAVYSTFVPSDARRDVVGCNDDLYDRIYGLGRRPITPAGFQTPTGTILDGQWPWASLKLTRGTYTLVWSTYSPQSTWEWSRGINLDASPTAPETFDPGESSLTYEVWGPAR